MNNEKMHQKCIWFATSKSGLSRTIDFLIEMLDKLLENLNRILGNQEKTLRESPVPSLPSRNQALAIAAKNYAKTDIEI